MPANSRLPDRPDLGQLRRQAKRLFRDYRAGAPDARALVSRYEARADPGSFALRDAQFVLARNYGYASWPKLKAYVDGVTVSRLLQAVRSGNAAEAGAVLGARPELVNTVEAGNREFTAIHYAVLGRQPGMVRLLMRAGANPHAGISPHNDATTALTIAADRGYDEIVAVIRDEERRREPRRPAADEAPSDWWRGRPTLSERDAIDVLAARPELVRVRHPREGRTPLHVASARLWTVMAAWLLDRGADVQARAKDGTTPLDVMGRQCDPAARAASLESMADLLLRRGAQPSARSAVILGDLAAIRAMRDDGALAGRHQDGLLELAVDYERPEILALLLDAGLDPDERSAVEDVENSFTWGAPLYLCARRGRHAMAEALLERGADPNGRVYASGTPLSEAYGQADDAMIALLERYGGQSNPSMAGLYRRADVARRLLAEYGDANLPDDGFGAGPVAEQLVGAAARGGDPEILSLALERIPWPPGDHRWYGALTGPLRLWNHGSGPWCRHDWDRGSYLNCFRMLLARSGPPVAQLRFGATLLHHIVTMPSHATADERVAFATVALNAGARLDVRDELLMSTPLAWACRWGREELVRLFVERGADPVEADALPWATPLAWAKKTGRSRLVTALREAGARPRA